MDESTRIKSRILNRRLLTIFFLLLASWPVMLLTHELGHLVGGIASGAKLISADLRPWKLPYSIFQPDPFPLITLWAGPILGVAVPLLIAAIARHDWIWFISNFCLLANGSYIAIAWSSNDRFLDTSKLLENGASKTSIAVYCLLTIGFGYIRFRGSCIKILGKSNRDCSTEKESTDEQCVAPKHDTVRI